MKNVLTALAAVLIFGSLNAQKIIVKKGDVSKLKSIKKWNVVFDYEGMEFDKKGNEQEWLKSTQEEKNKKEAGSGDAFVDDWNDAKDELFPSSYASGFNKVLEKKYGVKASPGSSGATMTVKTTWAFAGYKNPATGLKPAKITATITFKNEEGDVLAVVEIIKVQGYPPGGTSAMSSVGYKVSERMSGSYTYMGMAIAKYLKKGAYK